MCIIDDWTLSKHCLYTLIFLSRLSIFKYLLKDDDNNNIYASDDISRVFSHDGELNISESNLLNVTEDSVVFLRSKTSEKYDIFSSGSSDIGLDEQIRQYTPLDIVTEEGGTDYSDSELDTVFPLSKPDMIYEKNDMLSFTNPSPCMTNDYLQATKENIVDAFSEEEYPTTDISVLDKDVKSLFNTEISIVKNAGFRKQDDVSEGCDFASTTDKICDTNVEPAKFIDLEGNTCFLCDEKKECFDSLSAFTKHVNDCHVIKQPEKQWLLECPICNYQYRVRRSSVCDVQLSLTYLINHMIAKHSLTVPSYIQMFQCKEEGCVFQTACKESNQAHKESHKKKQLIPCDYCGKEMRRKCIEDHLQTCPKYSKNTDAFYCPECNKKLASRYILMIHISRMHTKVQSFLCSICPASFFAKTDLERHMYSKHDENITGKPVKACTICNVKTLSGSMWRAHMLNHKKGNHPCPTCGKKFDTNSEFYEYFILAL